jgi:hypothetical protein
VAFALHRSRILRSTNLVDFQTVPSPWLTSTVEAIAVDRECDPVAIYASSIDGVWRSPDLGASWQQTNGLPRQPFVNQLEIVDTGPSGRWIHAGTWNWSVWRARLP